MDTERLIPFQDFDLDSITLPDLSAEELRVTTEYVEITRHLQEISQLFSVFRYDLQSLLNVYDLNNKDELVRRKAYVDGFDDRTEINALVISYLSAGKTLTDSLKTCVEKSCSTLEEDRVGYQELLTRVYDGAFSYRLLVRLRDYAQHGHLPVSIVDNRLCFDLGQIINTPHFNHNKSLKGEMETFIEELLVKHETQPRYVFTLAMAEYTASMAEIYDGFWEKMERAFTFRAEAFQRLIGARPDDLEHKRENLKGFFFYLIENTLHCFNAMDDSFALFRQCQKAARAFLESQQLELRSLRSSLRLVPMGEGAE